MLDRHWPVLRRESVADLLHVALAVGEVEAIIRVLATTSPQPFIAQQLNLFRFLFAVVVFKVVVSEDGHGAFGLGFAAEDKRGGAGGIWWLRLIRIEGFAHVLFCMRLFAEENQYFMSRRQISAN